MITAYQASKLHAAQALYDAKEKIRQAGVALLPMPSNREERLELAEISARIDAVFALLIPNN